MNDVKRYVERLRLPWRARRAELIARFGLRRGQWSLDEVIELAISPKPFPRLVRIPHRRGATRGTVKPVPGWPGWGLQRSWQRD